jgi:hypothetical protein
MGLTLAQVWSLFCTVGIATVAVLVIVYLMGGFRR